MTRPLGATDIKQLSEILARQAAVFPPGVAQYYRDLVQRTDIKESWKREIAGIWTGSADYDARLLIRFAAEKGTNPIDPRWTTLGSLLRTMLDDEDVGLDVNSVLLSFIEVFTLADTATREVLRRRYGIPALASAHRDEVDEGPAFDWRGPTDEVELQAWIKREPPLLDVGFLSGAIRRAASVCRIELAPTALRPEPRRGTGVVISPGVVLTNYHVMQWHPEEDIIENARATTLRFGCFTLNGDETAGLSFELAAADPISHMDPILDFAVLRAGTELASAESVMVSPLSRVKARLGSGLNLIQHPRGETMKLAISANGITGVFENGFVQYVTNAAAGSSGSPCFDDDWNLVALHHAQRSRPFGRVGEGVLASRILDNIAAVV